VSHIVLAVPPAPAVHLKPAAELAERVLLPGDPHRALWVAQALLERPRMFNHHRGLWGYTGVAPDGEILTVQATGMGGPSAAIVVHELLGMGARTLVRIGTCGALVPGLELGQLVAVDAAIAADGASRALGAGERVAADPGLAARLRRATGSPGATVVSTDLFYDERDGVVEEWVRAGAVAVEMEAAAVLRVAERRGAAAACVLAVSDLPPPERTRIGAGELEAAGVRLGEAALRALGALA
jgi:DeoD family purine-nucleoside phosphorylase